jgi:hypothetical protein
MARCLLGHDMASNPPSPAVWKLGLLNYQLREKKELWKPKQYSTVKSPYESAKEALKGKSVASFINCSFFDHSLFFDISEYFQRPAST